MGLDHLPILIGLQMAPSSTPSLHRNYVNLKKAWRYSKDIEETLSTEPDPTDCQQGEKILRAAILKSASHHIPSGRHKFDHTEALPVDIVDMISARDDLRSRDPTSPALSQMNDEINQAKNRHKRDKWRTFVETLDHKSASSKLWRTIKTLDGKSTQTAENEAITFNGSQVSSPKQIANRFNEQFTTSKLGRHNSSRKTRLVSREVRRNPNDTIVTFTTDLVTRAIRSCSNTKASGPDKLSIFHLKHLGPRATAYLTALFNDSVNSSRIPAIWKSSIVIPIPKPGKDTSQGTSYRPISLICEGFGSTYTTHSQRSSTPRRRPTRIPTWTFHHLCTVTTYHRYRNWIQPKEATPSDGLRRCRSYYSLWHSKPQCPDIEDLQIYASRGYLSMAILLPPWETSCDQLQRSQVVS